MEVKVRLKEGYFKTKEYLLSVTEDLLILSFCENSESSKTFNSNDLISITIFKNDSPKVELRTKNDEVSLLLIDANCLCELQTALLNFKSRIIYEE